MFLAANWGIYVYSVSVGEVNQASLGYFINPLVTVLLAVGVLREAVAPGANGWRCLGGLAAAGAHLGYGGLPWIGA